MVALIDPIRDGDTIESCSSESLAAVGEVVLEAASAIEARLGEQSDVLTKALARCAPSLAMRSILGVSRNAGEPSMNPMKSYR